MKKAPPIICHLLCSLRCLLDQQQNAVCALWLPPPEQSILPYGSVYTTHNMGLPVPHLGMVVKATVLYVARWSKTGIQYYNTLKLYPTGWVFKFQYYNMLYLYPTEWVFKFQYYSMLNLYPTEWVFKFQTIICLTFILQGGYLNFSNIICLTFILQGGCLNFSTIICVTFILQGGYLNFSACFKKNMSFEQKELSYETNQPSFWIHV
jgi:hypothetical protein